MKMFLVFAVLLLGNLGAAHAQLSAPRGALGDTVSAPSSLSPPSRAKVIDALHPILLQGDEVADLLATPEVASALPADSPAPAPEPKFIYGGRDDYRWQLGLGATWFRFQSSVFNANEIGLKTTVSYFLNDWLGVEGSFIGGWGSPPAIVKNQDAKIAIYGFGPKIAWRQKRWEPWVHAMFGGAHENPQVAAGSRTSSAILGGVGADYRWNPRISFRAEGNYIRTGFFGKTQNNLQVAGGIVFHF